LRTRDKRKSHRQNSQKAKDEKSGAFEIHKNPIVAFLCALRAMRNFDNLQGAKTTSLILPQLPFQAVFANRNQLNIFAKHFQGKMQLSSISYKISRPQIIREQFDEEVVIVDLETGSYYALGGAGGDVWSGIEAGENQSQIVSRLVNSYSGEKEEIEAATLRLLEELQQEELIAPQDSAPQAGSTPDADSADKNNGDKPAFEAPILQKFTDMQALLLLDPIHEVDSAGWPQPKPEEPQMDAAPANPNPHLPNPI
jgi:hypothetical protein